MFETLKGILWPKRKSEGNISIRSIDKATHNLEHILAQ